MKNILPFTNNLNAMAASTGSVQNSNYYNLKPETVAKWFSIIILFLFIAHVVSLYLKFTLPPGFRMVILLDKYFNFNNEANFPTFFSSLILLIAACLIFFIYNISDGESLIKNKKVWRVL